MSEVSMLSAQFRALSKNVDHVNHAVIVFKAQMVNAKKGDQNEALLLLEDGELDNASVYMKDFLEKVTLLEKLNDLAPPNLSNAVASKLKKTVITDTPHFFERLQAISMAMEKKEILSPAHFELLDQIVEALDQERSELFKKLRAARG